MDVSLMVAAVVAVAGAALSAIFLPAATPHPDHEPESPVSPMVAADRRYDHLRAVRTPRTQEGQDPGRHPGACHAGRGRPVAGRTADPRRRAYRRPVPPPTNRVMRIASRRPAPARAPAGVASPRRRPPGSAGSGSR